MTPSTNKTTGRLLVQVRFLLLFIQPWDIALFACVCVCALACPARPGLRRPRFPVGTADIPALVNQAPPRCASPVSEKADFGEAKQKPEVLRGTDVEEEEVGGGENRRLFVLRLYIMHK